MKTFVLARAAMLSLGIAGLALIAGCHSATPDETVDNTVVNTVETTINTVEPANIVAPPPALTNASVPTTRSDRDADFTRDAQTQDDADASGMTAKLPQDNGAQPVKQ